MTTDNAPDSQHGIAAEIRKAAVRAATGVRDLDAMFKAAAEMDRLSAEIWRRSGILDIAVPYIRELRNQ